MPRCFEIFLWASPLFPLFLFPSLLPEEREANPLRSQMERPRWSKADARQISAVTPSSMMSPQFSSIWIRRSLDPGPWDILGYLVSWCLGLGVQAPTVRDSKPLKTRNTYEPLTKLRLLGVEKMCQPPSGGLQLALAPLPAHPQKIFQSILWAKKDEEGKKWRCAE